MAKVKLFGRFKHPELAKIGIEEANEAFFADVVKNTNFLIDRKLHVPPFRETHSKDGASRGSFEDLSHDAKFLYGDLHITPEGKKRIGDKEYRWRSAGFRRNFRLTGEPDGPVLPGPYLHHVAMLGEESPACKLLGDNSEIQFSERDGDEEQPRAFILEGTEDEEEIVVFSEILTTDKPPETGTKEPKMAKDLEDRLSSLEANFAEKENENKKLRDEKKDLEARFADSELKRRAAEDLAEEARFAVEEAKAGEDVNELNKALQIGPEAMKAAKQFISKLLRMEDGLQLVKEFTSVLKLNPKVGAKGIAVPVGEGGAGAVVTEAMFSEAIANPEVADVILKEVERRRKENPKFTKEDLRREIAAN